MLPLAICRPFCSMIVALCRVDRFSVTADAVLREWKKTTDEKKFLTEKEKEWSSEHATDYFSLPFLVRRTNC